MTVLAGKPPALRPGRGLGPYVNLDPARGSTFSRSRTADPDLSGMGNGLLAQTACHLLCRPLPYTCGLEFGSPPGRDRGPGDQAHPPAASGDPESRTGWSRADSSAGWTVPVTLHRPPTIHSLAGQAGGYHQRPCPWEDDVKRDMIGHRLHRSALQPGQYALSLPAGELKCRRQIVVPG